MQDFKWKKDESDWLRNKDEINHSLPVYRVPIYLKGEQLIPKTGFEGETCNSPCNQNKKYPNKNMRMVGSWNSPLRLMDRLLHDMHLDFWIDSINTLHKNRPLIEMYQTAALRALWDLWWLPLTSGGLRVWNPFILEVKMKFERKPTLSSFSSSDNNTVSSSEVQYLFELNNFNI